MRTKRTWSVAGGVTLALAVAAGWAVQAAPRRPAPRAASPASTGVGPVTGPMAEYWISADTSSGLGANMSGGGGRPSMGAVLGMMSGRELLKRFRPF